MFIEEHPGTRAGTLARATHHSAADREAILGLISKWWTDRESGVSDPERLRQLGFHRIVGAVAALLHVYRDRAR